MMVLGGATAFFSSVISPILAQRQEKFLKTLMDELEILQERFNGFNSKLNPNIILIRTKNQN